MKIVRITMEGGVVQGIEIPRDVQVIVTDYDVEGCEDITKDAHGDACVVQVWDHDEKLDAGILR